MWRRGTFEIPMQERGRNRSTTHPHVSARTLALDMDKIEIGESHSTPLNTMNKVI